VAVSAFALLGALLASRRPDNAIGWIFAATAVVFGIAGLAAQVATYGLVTNPGSTPGAAVGAWLGTWIWAPGAGVLMVFSLLLFPHGHLPSTRWRPIAWLGGVAIAAAAVPVAIAGWPLRGPGLLYENEPPPSLPHAYRLAVVVQESALSLIFLLALVAAISLLLRGRRAQGEEREQIRWFAYGGTIMVIGVVASIPGLVGDWTAVPGFLALPVAATIAILKYRLYDIDVVINKTVVYGVLAAFFTFIYVAIVVGIGTVVGSRSSRALTVLAAVVMAVAFHPVRERARRFANRLVYGKRATPYEVLSEFAGRMGAAYSTEDVLPRMARMLAEGTGANLARVWLRVGDRLRVAASWPNGAAPPEELDVNGEDLPEFAHTDGAFAVTHQSELLGALTVAMPANEPLSPVQGKLIGDLASQAGLVLRNERLIEELRASRQRLVAAHDQERRRLERNIHDGAQQQLVALSIKLGLLGSSVGRTAPEMEPQIRQLQADTTDALENLRDLARGIYPPLLADQGLPAALRAQARKASLPVTVEADSVGRYQQEVEAAVYFCCLEALQNVAKYAGASSARVALHVDHGHLLFEVWDDGRGFDAASTPLGSGTQNMTDRLASLGGRLEIRSEPGSGTTVRGRIPIGR
jgi:signal transduction histidine kinase